MLITCLDDDPRVEPLLRRMLGRIGHTFRFNSSISAFKAEIAEQPPDLVLLDLGLGQETGVDVIHWLAENNIRQPLVLISGRGDGLLDTTRRIANSRGIPIRGIINKARLASELPALLDDLESMPLVPEADAPEQDAAAPDPAPRSSTPPPQLDAALLQSLITKGDKDTLVPYLQPIVSLADGSLRGAEVLARLRLPDGSMLDANNFIALAENQDLLYSITESLFRTVVAHRTRLSALNFDFLAVNLSAGCLRDQRTIGLVRALISTLNTLCEVQVEITETAVSRSSQQIQSLAARLKLAGTRLVIDDFGTGYSSMRALAELPFEILKIDLSFVSEMFDSPKSLQLLRAIIGFGRNLDLQLVAEGVETEAQREVLVSEGVPLAQGYLFGEPMPISRFIQRFSNDPLQAGINHLSTAL
ncbi:MAG: EAL domain-containing protein [Chromatiaceae bacterium]|nr:EAL domain-containing protein [Chromatiaceae bacterium]